jgi:hypothetical protein
MVYNGQTFHVWRPKEGEPGYIKVGKYLVDDRGAVRVRVDPSIMGKLTHRDDGTKVSREFEAPKTQVMALIINSVLGGTLNWTLLVIGAMIAITLELCGISSLAFAVGVYVPIQFSTPIFLGGLARWGIDAYTSRKQGQRIEAMRDPAERARAEVEALAKSESSSGILLASGYIAGGSLAGVLIAFLEFSPYLKEKIDFSSNVENTFWSGDISAMLVFGVLILLLVLTGLGRLFSSPEDEPPTPGSDDSPMISTE